MHELGLSEISRGILTVEDDGRILEEHSLQFDTGLGITLSRMVPIADQAVLDLAYERSLPIVDELVLNARRSILFEEYRVAVIEAETAFEASIDRLLTRYYLSQTTRSSEGYVVPAYSEEIVNRLLSAGLKNLLESHLPKATGRKFIGTRVHGRWEEELYNLRNAVVHDGREVQPDEAERALEAAEDALVWVGAISPEQWPVGDRLNK